MRAMRPVRCDLSDTASAATQDETAHQGRLHHDDRHQKPHDPAGPRQVGQGGSAERETHGRGGDGHADDEERGPALGPSARWNRCFTRRVDGRPGRPPRHPHWIAPAGSAEVRADEILKALQVLLAVGLDAHPRRAGKGPQGAVHCRPQQAEQPVAVRPPDPDPVGPNLRKCVGARAMPQVRQVGDTARAVLRD
jgi:hypothetical protein